MDVVQRLKQIMVSDSRYNCSFLTPSGYCSLYYDHLLVLLSVRYDCARLTMQFLALPVMIFSAAARVAREYEYKLKHMDGIEAIQVRL